MALFRERLKELRLERGLTQDQLADALDIPPPSIRRLEVQDSLPRKERLLLFSSFFGVSIDYLVGNSDQRNNNASMNMVYQKKDKEELSRERTEFVIRELVKKYNLDLTNPQDAETLEDMIKIVHRNHRK